MAAGLSTHEVDVVRQATSLLGLASVRVVAERRLTSSLLEEYSALYVSLAVHVCACRGANLLASMPDQDPAGETAVTARMDSVELVEEAHRLLVPLAMTCRSVGITEFVVEVGRARSELRRHVGRV